ncbi:hypothetical protein GCM10011391_39880 [Pullulanibacillus camelliae]|uniref:Uncharacterized protein n=1 Tax=Pullulanibacillus camelliae TaxID=1707096 RepID=A0A8J3E160_9BACL|nr:hypothetical protein GCM10011391_39880 [Pullulanibacillus camelliae]
MLAVQISIIYPEFKPPNPGVSATKVRGKLANTGSKLTKDRSLLTNPKPKGTNNPRSFQKGNESEA